MVDQKQLPGRKVIEGTFEPEVQQPTVFRTVKGKKSLCDWIRAQFAREDQEGFITSIVLEHQVAPNTYEVHHTYTVGQSNADPLEISRLLWDVADTYCQDLSGNNFFRLAVFWNHNTVWGAIHPFVVGGRIDPALLAADNPDQKGLLQSGMHYAQQTQELYLKHMDSMLVRLNETLMTFASSQARLMEENTKAYDACKSLLLEKELNKQAYEMEKLKYERSSTERKELLGMVMPAVNAITGKEVFQYSQSDSKLLELMVDLPEEDLEKMIEIASKNNPKLFALLMARFHTIANTKQLPHRSEEALAAKQSPDEEFGNRQEGQSAIGNRQEQEEGNQQSAIGNRQEQEKGNQQSAIGKNEETQAEDRQPIAESSQAESRQPAAAQAESRQPAAAQAESREPIAGSPPSKDDVVKEFMNLSDDDILEAIQKDPDLMAKFKARMGRGTATRKTKGKA